MKRQVLTLIAVLALVVVGALFAQSGGSYPAPSTQPSAQQPSSLPPSQQVDESGKPETGPGPDVDVDTGRNADNGVLDVDVSRQTDPDTSARGDNDRNNTTGTMGTTGTRNTTGTTGNTYDNDTTTGVGGDTDNLPNTGSEMPLVGLIGLLALGAALVVRSIR